MDLFDVNLNLESTRQISEVIASLQAGPLTSNPATNGVTNGVSNTDFAKRAAPSMRQNGHPQRGMSLGFSDEEDSEVDDANIIRKTFLQPVVVVKGFMLAPSNPNNN